jgi:hypothetical protein
VNYRPYYPLVVDLVIGSASTETWYKPSDIAGSIISQLGLPAAAIGVLVFKVQRVDVYTSATASSTDRPAVSLQAASIIPSVSDSTASTGDVEVFYSVLKRCSDVGNLSESAKVGYAWPLAMADMPLSGSQSFNIFAAAGNAANTTVRVHLQWSTAGDMEPVQLR